MGFRMTRDGCLNSARIAAAFSLVVAISLAGLAAAHAQATESDNESKILRCRQNSSEIIWLDRAALRARCGIWAYANTKKTAADVAKVGGGVLLGMLVFDKIRRK